MKIQKSYLDAGSALYLIATPIGNFDDMTFRSIEVLKNVDYIYCEDTRITKVLLSHFDIKTPLRNYHIFNEKLVCDDIIELLKNGCNIALVSDAGLPCISDPGYLVASIAIEEDIKVVSLPGASASLTCLIASGLPCEKFYFNGFLNIYEVLGNRKIVLGRELTKKFEEYIRGNVLDLINEGFTVKGEMVLILEGCSQESEIISLNSLTVKEHFEVYIKKGLSEKDAIKQVASDRNVAKNEVYKEIKVK